MDIQKEHKIHRIGWLRAAVLGANDGIISTASLTLGVAAAGASTHEILLAGIAGLVAGSVSMATGEYVSVSSQADTENAELLLESRHLSEHWEMEQRELAAIYVDRGLDPELAKTVAGKLMDYDALGAHVRDELGMSHTMRARPLQAAFASAVTFGSGAALPLIVVFASPHDAFLWLAPIACLIFLAVLGWLAAWAGGSRPFPAIGRVVVWGAIAMALTAVVGALVGRAV